MGENREMLRAAHGMAAVCISSHQVWLSVQGLHKIKPDIILVGVGEGLPSPHLIRSAIDS